MSACREPVTAAAEKIRVQCNRIKVLQRKDCRRRELGIDDDVVVVVGRAMVGSLLSSFKSKLTVLGLFLLLWCNVQLLVVLTTCEWYFY